MAQTTPSNSVTTKSFRTSNNEWSTRRATSSPRRIFRVNSFSVNLTQWSRRVEAASSKKSHRRSRNDLTRTSLKSWPRASWFPSSNRWTEMFSSNRRRRVKFNASSNSNSRRRRSSRSPCTTLPRWGWVSDKVSQVQAAHSNEIIAWWVAPITVICQ